MTSQQLKRANEIEEEIKELLYYKGSIVKYKIDESDILTLTNKKYNFSIHIKLSFLPFFNISQFLENYMSIIDKKIEKLEQEFDNL